MSRAAFRRMHFSVLEMGDWFYRMGIADPKHPLPCIDYYHSNKPKYYILGLIMEWSHSEIEMIQAVNYRRGGEDAGLGEMEELRSRLREQEGSVEELRTKTS